MRRVPAAAHTLFFRATIQLPSGYDLLVPPHRALLVVLCLTSSVAGAFEVVLDRRSIEDAIAIGQSSIEKEQARFHEPYRLLVSRPPIDYIDIVTPFRRVTLAAQARARLGDRRFGQADALNLLEATSGAVGIYVEVTFHPLNTYVGVPDYRVRLISMAGVITLPRSIDRVPRFGPRLDGLPLPYPFPGPPPSTPGRSLPMQGATVVGLFDGRQLDSNGSYTIAVSELEKGEKELARVRVDFGKLR